MKLVFVYWGYGNAGSMLDLRGYARAAHEMGHEVTLYGPPNPTFALDYSRDLADADAVIFVFEWTTELQFGDRLDWARLVEAVPRHKRIVIDCDGAYNEPDPVRRRLQSPRRGLEPPLDRRCDSLTDKIFQPTLRPQRKNVRPFLFHIYDPDLGDAAEFHRQGIQHDLRRPHQIPLARHVEGAARDRARARPGRPRGARRRRLGQAARTGWSGASTGQTTSSTATT